MGLYLAGFDVTGCDIEPQPYYPFQFIQADALSLDLSGYDCYWASPMCQEYTKLKFRTGKKYPTQIEPTRERLAATGKPYVIENVPGAPLLNPVLLCGTMFGLKVIRHRHFESNVNIFSLLPPCNHAGRTAKRGKTNTGENGLMTITGHNFHVAPARKAMGIDWMTAKGLAQAIPPAYSEYLGRRIIEFLN